MAESANAFSLFHPKVQEWIYKEGWEKLNDAQVKAAYAITKKENDLVISAPTASEKRRQLFCPHFKTNNESKKGEAVYILCLTAQSFNQ